MGKLVIAGIAFYLGYRYALMTPEQKQNILGVLQSKIQRLPSLATSTPQASEMNVIAQLPDNIQLEYHR